MVTIRRNKKLIFITMLAVGLIALLVFLIVRPRQVQVEIFAVPSDSEVTMDGKPFKSGKTTISAGKHTFTASRQYFESITKEVDTGDLTEANAIYLAIYPNSPEGRAYLESHPDEQLRYERVSGAEFSALQEKIFTNYPITSDLPYQTTDFKIDYDISIDQNLVYLVTLYPVAAMPGSDLYKQQLAQYKNEALAWLTSKGVDTSTADIRYTPDPDGS